MELRHAPLLTLAALLRAALGLAISLLAIRSIGAQAFGYYSLVWSFCTAFLFMYSGVNTIVVAKMVEARATGEERPWMTAGLLLSGVALLVVVAVAAAVAGTELARGPLRAAMVVCPLMLACQIVTLFCCATLDGRGLVARAALLPVLANFGAAAYLAVALAIGRPLPELGALLGLLLGAYAIEAAIAVAASARQWAGGLGLAWHRGTVKALLVGGISTQAANMVGFLLDPWSKGVLAVSLGPAAVAIFDLSMKVGWGLHAVFSAYARLFLQIPPSAQDRRLASLRLAAELTWTPAALTAAIGVSVLPPLLSAWLHVDQAPLAVGMAMALAACMLMTVASAAFISLIGFSDHGFIFRNQLILGLANVVAAPLLVPLIGFAGAFVGSLVGTLINVGLISRRLQHHMPAFDGLTSLARPFVGRLCLALAVFGAAWLASAHAASMWLPAALAVAAAALLLREPLAHATWRKLFRKMNST